MCMRVNEVDQLQICDVLWRFNGGFHPRFSNTLACCIYKRKQDQTRKELYPRAGKAVFTLLAFTDDAGLEVAEGCTKGRSPGARCRACVPLFSRIVNGAATSAQVSRKQVTNAVLNALQMIGVDTKHYSCLSMRCGRISEALAARRVLVPKPIVFLQSGHRSNCAALNYMVPKNPNVLDETYLTFGLDL
jgi:hypothetical protein